MGRKEVQLLIYTMALERAKKLGLENHQYHKRFLAAMVTRKYRHRRENMEEVAAKAAKYMPELYKEKKDIVLVSAGKALDQLEIMLDNSEVDDKFLSGQVVSNIVKQMVIDIAKELGQTITEEDLSSKK